MRRRLPLLLLAVFAFSWTVQADLPPLPREQLPVPPKIQEMIANQEQLKADKVKTVVEFLVKGEHLYYFEQDRGNQHPNVPAGQSFYDAKGELALRVVIGGVVGIQIVSPKPSRFTLQDYQKKKRLRTIWQAK